MTDTQCFARRRQAVLDEMADDSALLLPAARVKKRNRDSEYPFRQESDFLYLTGYPEPDAWLLLRKRGGECLAALFVLPRDPQQEVWTGYRIGPERAAEQFGLDAAWPLAELDSRLPELLSGVHQLYYPMGREDRIDSRIQAWRRAAQQKSRDALVLSRLVDSGTLIHPLRLIKGPEEIALMRRAAEVSARAHRRAMRVCRPGMWEYQLQAEIEHEFALHGCRHPAYGTIVGGGANACVLHYVENGAQLRDGDLVLIDAGCEAEGYAGDITRTFPVNGRFSEPQRKLYELVLAAQEAAIAAIAPGVGWNEPHEAAVRVLTEGLVELGLLSGSAAERIADESYRRFYMHRTGHWLGLDVHDVGDYKLNGDWRPLEPGMVLTVEPGLYVPPGAEGTDPCWHGIGIRIEDDVLVTEDGCEVLTGAVPKAIDEIEALMAEGRAS